jgi:FKBP-type peptidyl-prolyl cis-trans isomerase FkpA
MPRRLALAALLLAAAAACSAGGDDAIPDTAALLDAEALGDPAGDTLVDTTYADSLRVRLDSMTRLPGGTYIRDLKVGSGAAADSGRTVTVHYTGWLTDGTKFDSSKDRSEPFVFPLGGRRVIAGWDEGVQGMRVGGVRKLTIPPALGYGARGAGGVIPPNATLVFEVELLGIEK